MLDYLCVNIVSIYWDLSSGSREFGFSGFSDREMWQRVTSFLSDLLTYILSVKFTVCVFKAMPLFSRSMGH